ncbi:protein NRT1/ PTR FAMILY 1.2-like [Senna tora]|uniref:Protein NRT1/ PTR FAMILY 1.2-like n=1 Tax=Senna tora TaxID=362788 RepID=A0A834WRU4_9FABA|nr:protein NRT1/ PTR FAMILY 1.2-like [Senna tora]
MMCSAGEKKDMEHIDADEKQAMDNMHVCSSWKPRKGGLRTMPFIIVNECFEKVGSYGILSIMILYLKNEYHMQTATAATILFVWSAISNAMSILGAFLSDSYFGRFHLILLGSISSFVGMTLLWSTALIPELRPPSSESYNNNSATPPQLALLFSSFALISIGAGCIRPCSIAFGADQLQIEHNSESDDRMLDTYFHWYYASCGLSSILALSVIVYIQDKLGWKVGFGVPAILLFLSALIFLLGSPYYVKVEPVKNSITTFVQVLVMAFKNRKLTFRLHHYYPTCDSHILTPTHNLRWLNKACIVRDGERESKPEDGSSSCTVEQVESVKGIVRAIPMWSTGIVMIVCMNQESFTNLRSNTMDRTLIGNFKIPAGSFGLFTIISLTIWICFYDRIMVPLLSKYRGQSGGLSCKVRMGMGLLFGCASTATSGIVESIRRREAIEEGVVKMSALWLVPAQALMGLGEGLNSIGQLELFYTCLPKTMSSFALAFYSLEVGVADLVGSFIVDAVDMVTSKGGTHSWLSSDINKGHLDYYYGLLTFLGLINYLYFLLCSSAYGPIQPATNSESQVTDQDIENFDYMELHSS